MKKFLIAASISAGLFLGIHDASAQSTVKTPLRIGMSFQELNNPAFVLMKQSLDEMAASIGATVVVTDARHDVSKQIADIEDMVQKKIDILLLNPTDSSGVQSAVKAAKAAGVVVVTVDANALGPVDSHVGSKNTEAGRISCEALARSIGGQGDVAILDGIAVLPILERVKGCREALARYPGIKIVSVQNGRQERATALTVTENILQAQRQLKGLFSVNDTGAMGALAAIEASGRDVKLSSVDGAPEAIKAMQKPGSVLVATAAQFPRDMVRLGLGIALARKWGANVPPNIPVEVKLIDAEGAKTFSW
ncbi:MAG: substrate-binding domain-containing protein [Curvibacter sp.]|nr:substrate-binding domain-containing protein [Curvibacter sp.]